MSAPAPSGATWRAYDGLESAIGRAGGEISDVLERIVTLAPEHHEPVMAAARALSDAMRAARNAAHDSLVAARGHRT